MPGRSLDGPRRSRSCGSTFSSTSSLDHRCSSASCCGSDNNMALRSACAVLVALWSLILLVRADDSDEWIVPSGSVTDFSSTFQNGNSVTLSWKAINSSICDLWVVASDASNDYATRIASNINLETAGTYPWTVSVGSEQVDIDDRYQLQFIPTGTEYRAGQTGYFSSPGFLLLNRGEAVPSSATSATATTATTSTSSSQSSATTASSSTATSSTSSSSDPSHINTGVIAGGVIAAIVAVVIILGLGLYVLRLRRRNKAAGNVRSQGIWPENPLMRSTTSPRTEKKISGLFEAKGDQQHPVELSARRKTQMYEMPA